MIHMKFLQGGRKATFFRPAKEAAIGFFCNSPILLPATGMVLLCCSWPFCD
jgi:hypothetical protein